MHQACVVFVVALAMFGPAALAKPGYAAHYDNVDYYVSFIVSCVLCV